MSTFNEKDWAEKYRPRKIEDCVLTVTTKKILSQIVSSGKTQNLLFTGGPGTGKTTAARAIAEELGCDVLVINASLNGNIDTLRTDIEQFVKTRSLVNIDRKKVVILDEADYLNAQSTQPALRHFIEQYSANCAFIMTANYPNRLLKELRSRMFTVDFTVTGDVALKLKVEFSKRVMKILDLESVKYDKTVVMHVVNSYFPDFRKTLNELQGYSRMGEIDSGMLSQTNGEIAALVDLIRERNFTEARKWIGGNSHIDPNSVMRGLFDLVDSYAAKDVVPMIIVLLSDYMHKSAIVADQEVNLAALVARIMGEI